MNLPFEQKVIDQIECAKYDGEVLVTCDWVFSGTQCKHPANWIQQCKTKGCDLITLVCNACYSATRIMRPVKCADCGLRSQSPAEACHFTPLT